MEMEIEESANAHPLFGNPVDTYLKIAFPEKETNLKDTVITKNVVANNLETSMRSHLLSLTDSILQYSLRNGEEVGEALVNLLEFLSSCLKLCNYIVVQSANPDRNVIVNATRVKQIPFLLLEDVFDTITSLHANKVWTKFVEEKSIMEILFSKLFFIQNSRLIFIRTCNKLYKKLSSEVEFSGRILMLLAAVFPLSERSAANVTGKFNTEKDVTFEEHDEWLKQQQLLENQNIDSGADDSFKQNYDKDKKYQYMDYQLYKTFWGAQKYFSDPKCILGELKEFESGVCNVLAAFEGNQCKEVQTQQIQVKRDSFVDKNNSHRIDNDTNNMDTDIEDQISLKDDFCRIEKPQAHYHHYLTSSQLLHLQISDPEIRIQFLTQLLIVCSHLIYQQNNNAKTSGRNLDREGFMGVVTRIKTRAENILIRTPPNGSDHLKSLEWILHNDENTWKEWKQKKCPNFEKSTQLLNDTPILSIPHLTLNQYEKSSESISEVSRALSSHKPKDLTVYLEDYADALDPEAGIEEEYHPKNNSVLCFRSLRLVKDSYNYKALVKVRKSNGDLEGTVREIWRGGKGVELPGEEDDESIHDDEDDEKEKDGDDPSVGSPIQEAENDEARKQRFKELIDQEDEELLFDEEKEEPEKIESSASILNSSEIEENEGRKKVKDSDEKQINEVLKQEKVLVEEKSLEKGNVLKKEQEARGEKVEKLNLTEMKQSNKDNEGKEDSIVEEKDDKKGTNAPNADEKKDIYDQKTPAVQKEVTENQGIDRNVEKINLQISTKSNPKLVAQSGKEKNTMKAVAQLQHLNKDDHNEEPQVKETVNSKQLLQKTTTPSREDKISGENGKGNTAHEHRNGHEQNGTNSKAKQHSSEQTKKDAISTSSNGSSLDLKKENAANASGKTMIKFHSSSRSTSTNDLSNVRQTDHGRKRHREDENQANRGNRNSVRNYDEKGGRGDNERNDRGHYAKRRRGDGKSSHRDNNSGRNDGRDGNYGRDGRAQQRDNGVDRANNAGRSRRRGDGDRTGAGSRDAERISGDGEHKNRRYTARRRRN